MMQESISVWVTSLGCPKNRVDTERLLGSLGLPVKFASSPGRARCVFINTCAFIEPATRESLRAIFDVAQSISKLKRKPALVVAGCLPGRYGIETLASEIPEVDLWLDSGSISQWPIKLAEFLALSKPKGQGRFCTGKSSAWLKIAEGCQQKCAFCTIPAIRGSLRSVPAETVIAEARQLLSAGVKELILVAQDSTAWGRDLIQAANVPAIRNLPDLVESLASLNGLQWLRLMYLYPAAISDRLLSVLGVGKPVLPYLDMPLQHSQPAILAAMGRPFSLDPRRIIAKIRAGLPDAALRTTLMVGFPGETERDFRALCEFVREARFLHLGVFAFQPEEGTPAANLPDQVPDEVKAERRAALLEIQAAISADLLGEFVGRQMDVLVDEEKGDEWPGLYLGRVWFQAPEVDGATWISGPGVECGKMLSAAIVDSSTYDLSALA